MTRLVNLVFAALALATLLPLQTMAAVDFYFVLGSFSTRGAAERMIEQAQETLDDIDVEVRDVEVDGKIYHRVVAGPWPDASAPAVKRELESQGFADAWILRTRQSGGASSEQATHAPVDERAEETPSEKVSDSSPPIETQPDKQGAHGDQTPGRLEKLLPDESEQGIREISLVEIVKMALERNLGLKASSRAVESGAEQVREAKGDLLPRVNASVRQTAIDQDRAEASFGQAPEFRTSASLGVRQSVYSDRAFAAVQIQELLQKARKSDRRKAALDAVLDASIAFLKLLRTRALATIVEDDLELTRSNYDRAQIRLELGVANKAEVYRWQTRRASSKRELNLAIAEVEKASIELNQVLNLPLGKVFYPEKPELKDGYLLFARDDVWQAIQDEERQDKLKDYWVTEALLFAPELNAVRNQRAAQYRRLLAAKRRIRIPEVLLSIDATKFMAEDGVGTEEFDLNIPGVESQVDFDTDNFEWSAAVTASMPLYGGGGNRAAIRKARAESERMDLLYDEALLAVQSGVLKNLAGFRASLNNIELARDQAEAATNNLDLVAKSYERGVVTIIDLLDAQVAALSADLSAANAVYDFLIEYMKLQRAVGRFDMALSVEERAAARKRLEPYIE